MYCTPTSSASSTTESPLTAPTAASRPVHPPNTPPASSNPPPASTTEPSGTKKVTQTQSFIRHTPSAYNHFAYQKKIGKELAPHLIDESGMAPRFHLLSAELFLDWVPGHGPSEADREKFKGAKLSESMSEHAMYPELAAVVQSVLDAAECDVLRFLDTANHKAKDGNSGRRDTFNDGGIYVNTPLAREATEFTSEHRARSAMTPDQLKKRLLGLRSWNWLDILFELKKSEDLAAFYFKTKPRGFKDSEGTSGQSSAPPSGSTPAAPPKPGSHQDEPAADTPAHEPPAGAQREDQSAPKPETSTRTVPPFVRLAKDGEAALAQFIEYMHNVRKCQHRIFSYAVYVCYDMARLFYFDRSGAYVSEPFSWVQPDSLLHQFVWKIATLANAGRFADLGRDPTAELVSGDLKDKFLSLKLDKSLPQHVREGFKKATADNCPIYQLEVVHGEPTKDEWFPDEPFPPPKKSCTPSAGQPPSDASSSPSVSRPSSSSDPLPAPPAMVSAQSVRKFLVGRPHFASDALIGRCTTGYYAYDVTDADEKNWRVCFLKDSWRPVVPGRTRPEHLLYERFRRHGVTPAHGIGTLLCGGDVGGRWAQKTRVQKHLPSGNRPTVRVHYRIVIEEIGVRLEAFRNFSELSAMFSDAMKAWATFLIRIQPDGTREGFLIDWDLSRIECELGIGPVEPDRTGTWQFRSALSLRYPWKPYRVSDDIESFVHAFIYLVLRYHAIDVASLRELVMTFFEGASLFQGIKIGGDRKLSFFGSVALPFSIPTNPNLEALLKNIVVWCTASYSHINRAEMALRYGFGREPEDTPAAPAAPSLTDNKLNLDRNRDLVVPCDDGDDEAFINANLGSGPRASPRRDAEPYVMTGFLSMHGRLLGLFTDYTLANLGRSDKDVDQFVARRHQDVYQGPTDPGNRRVGSMSMTGTFPSGQMSTGSSGNFGLDFPIPGSTGDMVSDSRKRLREDESSESESDFADEGEGPCQPTHLTKRAKQVVEHDL
uniref:2-octaprenylphenol hydroxylase ) n=1 Tax=Ganoderma boninense TaxID=34458 RepID=A0A5K1JZF4_9APHY|nr:2-octaprenylphenol hydroxylase (EC (2-polyprenylphenol 6-hydroxylase) [Ganoderma boninense]